MKTLIFLFLSQLLLVFSAELEAGEKKVLQLIIGTEVGLESNLPENCKNKTLLFKYEHQNRMNLEQWALNNVNKHSKLLFGEENRLRVAVVTFTMDDIEKALKDFAAKNPSEGVNTRIPSAEPVQTVDDYIKFLAELKAYDKARFHRNVKYRGMPVWKYCERVADGVFSQAAWNQEILRRGRRHEYFSVVAWYLKEYLHKATDETELVAPVILYPIDIWDFDKPGLVSDAVAKVIKGQGNMQELVSTLSKNATRAGGRLIWDPKKEVDRGPLYRTSFVRRKRLGLIVGSYVQQVGTAKVAYLHEVGHYVGLPHVFSDDRKQRDNGRSVATTERCHDLIEHNSFIKTWNKAGADSSKRKKMCECYFVERDSKTVYEDYDGHEAMVYDTSLAVINRKKDSGSFKEIYYLKCADESKKYKAYFGDQHDGARSNIMTYTNKDEDVKLRKAITDAQRRVARDVIDSFK